MINTQDMYNQQSHYTPYDIPQPIGMTLRDYFAAAALTGLMASPTTSVSASARVLAQDAYAQADAMLTERNKKNV